MNLSDRINDTNAAPWVIEEINNLEDDIDILHQALKDSLRYFDQVIVETGYQSEGERLVHASAHAALRSKPV